MTTDDGIIDIERNPFIETYWVNQGNKFSRHRSVQIEQYDLIGKTVEEIMSIKNHNIGSYPVFVAIRWGFLKIENDRLVTTHKWDDRELYFKKPSKPKVAKPKMMATSVAKPQPPRPHHTVSELIDLDAIRNEIKIRREVLIERAHDDSISMDRVEREHIIEYLEKENLPQKPDTEIQLLKEFVSSALSMNQAPFRTRSKLKKFFGEIVLGDTVDQCLAQFYDDDRFLSDESWAPEKLQSLAAQLGENKSDKFKSYVLRTTESIATVMQPELKNGLSDFYSKIDDEIAKGPDSVWRFMEKFTKPIYYVGPGLMSDFLKNSGFPQFVKIDVHLEREFPALLPVEKKDAKSLFIHAWHLCEKLGITPFIFDHIMYQWGRAKL